MHWTNLNKQFETIGSLALLYIYNDAIIGSIYNTWFSIMRIKHKKYITEIEKKQLMQYQKQQVDPVYTVSGRTSKQCSENRCWLHTCNAWK